MESNSMIESRNIPWQIYLMEYSGLAGFVFFAWLLTIFLEHPDLPVMKSSMKDYSLLRRIPLGIIMGAYIMMVIALWGKKSGAHINPAVTWTFYRLGKISFTNAVFYTIAQFGGAISAAQLLKYWMGPWFSHPLINYGNTQPQPPHGSMAAFVAEFLISFIMMLVVLLAGSSKRFEKKGAFLSGLLIALFLIIEMPFSGMSLNPARSFAGALAANEWTYVWIYFVAPPLAMLVAAEVFLRWKSKQVGSAGNTYLAKVKPIKSDYKELPQYPVQSMA